MLLFFIPLKLLFATDTDFCFNGKYSLHSIVYNIYANLHLLIYLYYLQIVMTESVYAGL